MKIIVNDANILIDLLELDILPGFFQLEFEVHTTAMILDELFDEQQEALLPYIESGRLIVDEISGEDLIGILTIRAARPNLSEQDCSAFYQAQKLMAALVTSDNTLRKFARASNLEVHGHLWIFDHLVSNLVITGQTEIAKLNELCNVVNPRLGLPNNECQKRIRLWSAG